MALDKDGRPIPVYTPPPGEPPPFTPQDQANMDTLGFLVHDVIKLQEEVTRLRERVWMLENPDVDPVPSA